MSSFEDYVNSWEVEEMVISPPLRELSSNITLGLFQTQRQLQHRPLDRIWGLLNGGLTSMAGWFMGVMFP